MRKANTSDLEAICQVQSHETISKGSKVRQANIRYGPSLFQVQLCESGEKHKVRETLIRDVSAAHQIQSRDESVEYTEVRQALIGYILATAQV